MSFRHVSLPVQANPDRPGLIVLGGTDPDQYVPVPADQARADDPLDYPVEGFQAHAPQCNLPTVMKQVASCGRLRVMFFLVNDFTRIGQCRADIVP